MYDIVRTKYGVYVLLRDNEIVIDSSANYTKMLLLERDIEKRIQGGVKA